MHRIGVSIKNRMKNQKILAGQAIMKRPESGGEWVFMLSVITAREKGRLTIMKKLIKNGMICTESQVFAGDILIEGEKIKAVGTGLADPGRRSD